MKNHIIFSIAFCVFLCYLFCPVQTADECQTHADCKPMPRKKFCCGGHAFFGDKQRSCTHNWCLYKYCSNDSDCGNASLCCRSNECVQDGCSGCTDDGNCSGRHVCCKKTFPLNETLCGSNCINQSCNYNDDCGGAWECCRSGKCVTAGCNDRCTSDSECDLGSYCCKKWQYGGDGCRPDCVDEKCDSDEDCGGPNECCISNVCLDKGCHGCNTSTDCYRRQYCCKKTFPSNESLCRSDCVNEPCDSSKDCGGYGECCHSGKCVTARVCNDQCASNSDCDLDEYCCNKSHRGDGCRHRGCVGEHCDSDQDCGGPNECCISSSCVTKGCHGCSTSEDCYRKHVCCKKTFPSNESGCAWRCVNRNCNSNNDCDLRLKECCRSGKCVRSGCGDRCRSNSECNLGEYCCKKLWDRGDSCRPDCVGEDCKSDEDCGGPIECCISNVCTTKRCHRCSTSEDCYHKQYCCKTTFPSNESFCRSDCINQPCNSTDDCVNFTERCRSGKCVSAYCTSNSDCGSGEECDSDNRCLPKTARSSNSLPSWSIAVIVVSLISHCRWCIRCLSTF